MNYEEFRLYQTEFLWRTGDIVFAENFDNIVDSAEAMINNKIYAKENYVTLGITAHENNDFTFPTDYRKVKAIIIQGTDTFTSVYATIHHMPHLNNRNTSHGRRHFEPAGTFHTISGQVLTLTGEISVENPIDFILHYYQKLVSYKDATEDFFRDAYPDLYEAAFCYRASKFLKDDEAAAGFMGEFDKAVEDVMDQVQNAEWSSPLYMQLPGTVR